MNKIYSNEGFVIAKLRNRRITAQKQEDGLIRITFIRLLSAEIVNLNSISKGCCNVINTRFNRVIITKSILLTDEAIKMMGNIITLLNEKHPSE